MTIKQKIIVPYLYHVIHELDNIKSQLVLSSKSKEQASMKFIYVRNNSLIKVDLCLLALSDLCNVLDEFPETPDI